MKKNATIEWARKVALKKLRSKLYKIFGCRSIAVFEHFSGIQDPRSDQGKRHPLTSITIIALCAVICGGNGWTQIEEFGRDKQAWFESFLDQDVKSYIGKKRPQMQLQMKKNLESRLKKRQRQPHIIQNFIKGAINIIRAKKMGTIFAPGNILNQYGPETFFQLMEQELESGPF